MGRRKKKPVPYSLSLSFSSSSSFRYNHLPPSIRCKEILQLLLDIVVQKEDSPSHEMRSIVSSSPFHHLFLLWKCIINSEFSTTHIHDIQMEEIRRTFFSNSPITRKANPPGITAETDLLVTIANRKGVWPLPSIGTYRSNGSICSFTTVATHPPTIVSPSSPFWVCKNLPFPSLARACPLYLLTFGKCIYFCFTPPYSVYLWRFPV